MPSINLTGQRWSFFNHLTDAKLQKHILVICSYFVTAKIIPFFQILKSFGKAEKKQVTLRSEKIIPCVIPFVTCRSFWTWTELNNDDANSLQNPLPIQQRQKQIFAFCFFQNLLFKLSQKTIVNHWNHFYDLLHDDVSILRNAKEIIILFPAWYLSQQKLNVPNKTFRHSPTSL